MDDTILIVVAFIAMSVANSERREQLTTVSVVNS